ncbi:unnamed protein product [Schistosoma margrebowiei]|uniref:Uncharacterized protein n=1 Tax=Schistosoma margrebowiei TaxID=48269 RepID=A0A183LMG2_9TREM|nr:unnamed protein product [Schistosoma margrebowiei]
MSSSRHIYYVAREMFPACLLAGVGMVVAGCYIDMLKSSVWSSLIIYIFVGHFNFERGKYF